MNFPDDLGCWTAVARLKPLPGNLLLGEARGAYVGIAALSSDEHQFRRQAREFFETLDFELLGLDDVAPITNADELGDMASEIQSQIRALTPAQPLTFGSFHSFD